MLELPELYHEGKGVAQDISKGIALLHQSLEAATDRVITNRAFNKLGIMYKDFQPYRLVIPCFESAIRTGDKTKLTPYFLAECHFQVLAWKFPRQ